MLILNAATIPGRQINLATKRYLLNNKKISIIILRLFHDNETDNDNAVLFNLFFPKQYSLIKNNRKLSFNFTYITEQRLHTKDFSNDKNGNTQCVKSVRIRRFSGPYFPAFRLNTEIYEVNLHIYSKCGKIRTRKTPNTELCTQ